MVDTTGNGRCANQSISDGSPVIGAPTPRPLRIAVQTAREAHEKSGSMLDAALAYAAHGFPVFPVTLDKRPVPRRDRDASGNPIPGTGSFKKATTDPIQIRDWWKGNEYLIGMPMGGASGVWCLDIDTSEDHADGVAEWEKIAAQHDPIVTREHRSATGGPHLIFYWIPAEPIRCGSGELPAGVDVKGQGGYIVMPPSVRKKRSYSVHSDIDPIDAPAWLSDLILPPRLSGGMRQRAMIAMAPEEGRARLDQDRQMTADLDEVADAMACIPDDVDWEEWKSMAMRLHAALGDEGFPLFDTWSFKSLAKYDADKTLEAWKQVQSSPANRTGVEKDLKIAREHGWVRKGKPTYPLPELFDPDEARREIRGVPDEFVREIAAYEMVNQKPPPPVWAVCVDTGVGKTRITIEALAQWLGA